MTDVTTHDSTPGNGCDCIEKWNLPGGPRDRHNTQLDTTLEIVKETGGLFRKVAISTSVAAKKRGARPIRVVPNYCPMCGTRYPTFDDAARPPAAEGEGRADG